VTAQVLLDALVRKEVQSVCRFSLIVIDECDHAQANSQLNQIMGLYLKMKLLKTAVGLPQVNRPIRSLHLCSHRYFDQSEVCFHVYSGMSTNTNMYLLIIIKLTKGKALRKHSLHEKTATSVLLKLFISSNE